MVGGSKGPGFLRTSACGLTSSGRSSVPELPDEI